MYTFVQLTTKYRMKAWSKLCLGRFLMIILIKALCKNKLVITAVVT